MTTFKPKPFWYIHVILLRKRRVRENTGRSAAKTEEKASVRMLHRNVINVIDTIVLVADFHNNRIDG